MSLNRIDYLLSCLGKECGEVQQMVGKSLRFGLLDHHPKKTAHNWVLLRQEVHDVIATYELLADEFDRVADIDRQMVADKQARTLHYMELSKSLGRLE